MNGKISSSKKEAKTAILFTWSLLVTFPAIFLLSYYLQNLREFNIGILVFALLGILACIGTIIATLVMFIIWFYKAYSTLYQKTPDLKYKKRWAVLSWIIPVVNFYLPYLLLKDMYSNIAILTNNSAATESLKKLTAVNIWWGLYILGWILDIGYYAVIYPDNSAVFNVVTYILIIPSVWFTVKIIQNYCEFEEKLFID
jgi:hypothetical protein